MAGLFVKKGDTVRVLSGKDRGAQGKVLVTSPKTDKVIVEGLIRVKPGQKVVPVPAGSPPRQPQGGASGDKGGKGSRGGAGGAGGSSQG